MKKSMKAVAALMLMTVAVCVVGCKKTDDLTHEYVDLGLPSGTLWATCNVGADTPEGYGDYFAWGETKPKTTYDWSTYKYCKKNSPWCLTKYCSDSSYGYKGFIDNLTTLQPSDDAATANWGSGWRMPTQTEWQELYDNTTHTWTSQNGLNGRLFVASNGKSIFLPATGGQFGTGYSLSNVYGYYWSSSLLIEEPSGAWCSGFESNNYFMDYGERWTGCSVRPVRSAK